ncbi:MAG: prepilin peptidase [Lachnospiraceae bacterium]|nr:prepilin peptidase [Lachnospiraceae bacterium]
MNRIISYCASLLFLAGLSAGDVREKKIPICKVVLFAISAILYRIITGRFSWDEIRWGIFPGCVLLLLALLTKENIGYGDGITVLALGLWTGGWFTLVVVCIGIMLSGVWGMVCIFRKKTEPIPFIPFLLLGMEVALLYA